MVNIYFGRMDENFYALAYPIFIVVCSVV